MVEVNHTIVPLIVDSYELLQPDFTFSDDISIKVLVWYMFHFISSMELSWFNREWSGFMVGIMWLNVNL